MKKNWLLIIALVIVIAISAYILIPTVDTNISCHGVSGLYNNGYITISLYYNESNGTGYSPDYIYLSDKAIVANLTDIYNESTLYNLTTNSAGEAKIKNLKSGKYNVTVSFAGDTVYRPSKWNGTIDLTSKLYLYNRSYYTYRPYTYYTYRPYTYNTTYYTYRYYPTGGYRYYYYYD